MQVTLSRLPVAISTLASFLSHTVNGLALLPDGNCVPGPLPQAQGIIRTLNLIPNVEKGYYIETYKPPALLYGTNRSLSTAIYYLLEGSENWSYWHKLDAVEIWHYYAGAPLVLQVSWNNGSRIENKVMGPNILGGERPQVVIETDQWQRARSLGKWTLIGTTMAPEFPGKCDFGNVDFLVSGPLTQSGDISRAFDFEHHVRLIKEALGTPHGRKGHLTENVMIFAIPNPESESELEEPNFWIQIDVKVCLDPRMFAWERFCLGYASVSGILGSMGKQVGLTIDPRGLWIRVEGLEERDWGGSLVFVSKEPEVVLAIWGLDGRLGCREGVFRSREDLYSHLASSWLFNPKHFAERMRDPNYMYRMEQRQAPFVSFVRDWSLAYSPGCRSSDEQTEITTWYKTTRKAVRDKIFLLYPAIAKIHYQKRHTYLGEESEMRLRRAYQPAIPEDNEGWSADLPEPPVILKPFVDSEEMSDSESDRLSRSSPTSTEVESDATSPMSSLSSSLDLSTTSSTSSTFTELPLLLPRLPRSPPRPYKPTPPPKSMSQQSKLECLYRWTLFALPSSTGPWQPYLASEPREKGFVMNWAQQRKGCEDEELARWARKMWWVVWARQSRVNYVGMWRRRFNKEDAQAEKARANKEGPRL
ncbi:hypothetical protein M011DRAFT_485816 [Sporormia fimetaria CBS 119925]|uniref:DUF985 domain-containing protein n=1 Tax=Sporormia fimetaria CBS 119925 TaxID=1340428 RepID=A0A6A6VDB4_9PLEO|nr:hypothetical protein M011DRAFT_485816 [Sporormia fimetaria CBS 119925]